MALAQTPPAPRPEDSTPLPAGRKSGDRLRAAGCMERAADTLLRAVASLDHHADTPYITAQMMRARVAIADAAVALEHARNIVEAVRNYERWRVEIDDNASLARNERGDVRWHSFMDPRNPDRPVSGLVSSFDLAHARAILADRRGRDLVRRSRPDLVPTADVADVCGLDVHLPFIANGWQVSIKVPARLVPAVAMLLAPDVGPFSVAYPTGVAE